MENRNNTNGSELISLRTRAFRMVEETDGRIRDLESTVRVLSMGLSQSSAGTMVEDVLEHLADSLQDLRARLDETASAMLNAMGRPAV